MTGISKSSLAVLAALLLGIGAWAAETPKTIPSGTELKIRTNETIDSKTAREDQNYSAVVDQDVVGSSGEILIPKGSDAQLVVRKASGGEVALDVDSVRIGGRRYLLNTTESVQSNKNKEGLGKNKRTGKYVGGGAVLGTVIGAIAGGGKGAAIGAVAGGAAGAGAQVMTKGKEVKVPAETVLTFKLHQPLVLEGS